MNDFVLNVNLQKKLIGITTGLGSVLYQDGCVTDYKLPKARGRAGDYTINIPPTPTCTWFHNRFTNEPIISLWSESSSSSLHHHHHHYHILILLLWVAYVELSNFLNANHSVFASENWKKKNTCSAAFTTMKYLEVYRNQKSRAILTLNGWIIFIH